MFRLEIHVPCIDQNGEPFERELYMNLESLLIEKVLGFHIYSAVSCSTSVDGMFSREPLIVYVVDDENAVTLSKLKTDLVTSIKFLFGATTVKTELFELPTIYFYQSTTDGYVEPKEMK